VSGAVPFARVTVFGGGGAVAALFARTLQAAGAHSLALVDLRPVRSEFAGATLIQDDLRKPGEATLAAVASSDLVMLAVPEAVAEAGAAGLVAHMKPGALLVETLSVKHGFASVVAGLPAAVEILGVNPMFAPGLGFTGRSVVAVPYRDGARTAAFLDFVRDQGASVAPMTADQHDAACAALQAATHAAILTFGMTLKRLGYDLAEVERLMPPPHRTLLALLARVLSADAEVYRGIQAANPLAAQVRDHMATALRDFDVLVSGGDSAAFRRLFDDLRGIFPASGADYAQLCARLFQVK
jgi:prephenate dehydrogenase